MKKILAFTLLFILCSYAFCQVDNSRKADRCYKTGKTFRKIGLSIGVPGLALFGGGLALGISEGGFSYSAQYNSNGGSYESGTPLMGLAGIMVEFGAALVATGTVFTIIGQTKINKCKRQYAFYPTPYGLGFCYRY